MPLGGVSSSDGAVPVFTADQRANDTAGRAYKTTDPAGKEDGTTYDHFGQLDKGYQEHKGAKDANMVPAQCRQGRDSSSFRGGGWASTGPKGS